MQIIIYRHNSKNKIARLNDSQNVLITAAWVEQVAEATIQEPTMAANPNFDETDPTSLPMIETMINKVVPAHQINHSNTRKMLSGQVLVDWFITNQMIVTGFDIVQYFVIPQGDPIPTGNEVVNVDYVLKTWENPPTDMVVYKEIALSQIKDFAQSIAEQFTKGVPDDEVKSWGRKEIAASNYMANTATTSDTTILQSEATVTGETLTELSTKISVNSQIYLPVIGKIAGIRRATTTAIMDPLVTTTAQVDAIMDGAKITANAELAAILAAAQGA